MAITSSQMLQDCQTPVLVCLVLECEIQPVKPTISSDVSSTVECILVTGSLLSYQRSLSVFTVRNLNWFRRALGKSVPGDFSSSAQ